MATMNISLPDSMRDWVQQQVQNRHYSGNSDYVQALIRQDRENRENREKHDALQRAITEGLESGVSDQSVASLIHEAKEELKG